jgi:hypothetical protein
MSGLIMMLFDEGTEHSMRCRFIDKYFKMDSYVFTKEKLLSKIDSSRPDVVVLDPDSFEILFSLTEWFKTILGPVLDFLGVIIIG